METSRSTSVVRDPCSLVKRFSSIDGVEAVVVAYDGLPVCWHTRGGVDVEGLAAHGSELLARGFAGFLDGVGYSVIGGGGKAIVSVGLGDRLTLVFLIGGRYVSFLAASLSLIGSGVRCPRCGYDLSVATSRCPKCGAVIPFLSPICTSCGAVVEVKRCPGCGARVDYRGVVRRFIWRR